MNLLLKSISSIVGLMLLIPVVMAEPVDLRSALVEAKALQAENPEKARQLISDQLAQAAETINVNEGAKAHLLIAATYIEEKKQPDEAKQHLIQAKNYVAQAQDVILEAEALLIEGRISAYFDSDVPAAIEKFGQGLQLLSSHNGPTPRLLRHSLHEALGRSYNDQAKFSQASQHMLTALALTQKDDDPLLKAWTRVYLAQSYKGLLQSQQAIKYLLSALSIAEQAANQSLEAYIFGRLGLVYKQLSNYSRAQDYVERAAEIYQSLNDDSNLANSLNFLGTIFEQQGQYDTALLHYLNALELTRAQPTATKLGLLYHNIGQIYLHLDDLPNAQRYLEQSLEALDGAKRNHYLSASHLLMAKLKYRQKAFDMALKHAHRALELSAENEYLFTPAEAHELLASLYAEQGEYQQAYEHEKRASEYQLPDQSVLPPVTVSEDIYQQQQLQRSVQNLRNQLETANQNRDKAQKWRNLLILVAIINLMITGVILRLHLSSQAKLQRLRQRLHLHPNTGLPGSKPLHDFLKTDIAQVQRQHETFYSDNSAQSKDARHFYFVIELPVLKLIYLRHGFKKGRTFEKQFGQQIRQLEDEGLTFFHPRDNLLCARLKGDNFLTEENAVHRIKKQLETVFTALNLSLREQLHSIAVISMPFLSKASRAIDGENLPELLLLALNGANQLRVIQGESSWLGLNAIDAAPATLFNSDARSATLLGIRKGQIKIVASHDKQLIEWPEE